MVVEDVETCCDGNARDVEDIETKDEDVDEEEEEAGVKAV